MMYSISAAIQRQAIALLLLAGAAPLAGQKLSPEQMREGDPRERAEWFRSQRAYPNREVPPGKVAAMRELKVSLRAGGFASRVGERWEPLGPMGFISMNTPYSSSPMTDEGRFNSVAIHPRDPRIILAGSGSAGVWRTTNGGASWQALTDFECSTSIGAITIDPVNPQIVYAGTGEIFDPAGYTDGCGILRSTNGGDTWTRLGASILSPPGSFGTHILRIQVDRASAGSTTATVLLAATSAGLLRSTDSGNSWSVVLMGEATDVQQHPTNPAIFYAALGAERGAVDNGIYRSVNRGISWVKISGVLGLGTTMSRIEMAVSPANPDALWVIMADPQTFKFRSLSRYDGLSGQWVSLPANGIIFQSQLVDFGDQSQYNILIGVDPDDANRIIIGGVRLFRSRDGGINFQQIASNVHSDWHGIAFDPHDSRRIVTACDGGIFTSTNGGDSWRSLNNGISATQFYPGMAVHPTNPAVVLGGTQDNGSMMSGGALFWSGMSFGDGGWAMIDYTSPNIMMTSSQGGNLQRHDLATRSFTPIQNNLVFQAPFITPFIMDPLVPRTIYAGTRALERSLDFGSTWTQLSPTLPSEASALAVNNGVPQSMVVGTKTGFIAMSTNGGATWGTGILVPRSTSDITFDPNDRARFGFTFSGFGSAKVVITSTGGLTFFDISGNLPDVPTNAFAFTPSRNRFFVGTDVGVFETNDAGVSWTLTAGLPLVPVSDLVYHAATNRLIASTYGRGIWSLPLGAAPVVLRGDVDRNGLVNAADALLIQRGLAAIPLPSPLTVMPHGDANCNGALDAADALIVLRFAVGLGTAGTCVATTR